MVMIDMMLILAMMVVHFLVLEVLSGVEITVSCEKLSDYWSCSFSEF